MLFPVIIILIDMRLRGKKTKQKAKNHASIWLISQESDLWKL